MAEQRGYFVASEWAQGGCTTLYQLPEEGRKVLSLLNDFHLCFSLSYPIGLDSSVRVYMASEDNVQVDPFYSTAPTVPAWLGGRGSVSVRMYAEALPAYGLHYIRTAF